MKTWVSHICFYKWSLSDFDASAKKVFKKFNETWSNHEFKGPVLIVRNENGAKVLFD